MEKFDFSHMADIVSKWADEEQDEQHNIHDLRIHVLTMALENAAGYDLQDIRDFAKGNRTNEYADVLKGLLSVYALAKGEDDMSNLQEFFAINFEHGLRPAWHVWYDTHGPEKDFNTTESLFRTLGHKETPPKPRGGGS